MKKLYMLCNAHLDPVWLWRREEGIAEALSTFRIAADFCEQYDGFVFNHNEALLYEWVEEYEPELFLRIQRLVRDGKWKIMGGWYLQPDCLMPSGESFIRQIETGRKYFYEKFGAVPKTAINFDSFGHTRGLVQLLKKCGYDSYVFMRPYSIVPEHNFIWVGYDGSEVIGHCISGGYNTLKGEIIPRIERELDTMEGDTSLVLWGVGNHGGGPSKIDLDSIERYRAEHPETEIIHSSCEEYFKDLCTDSLSKRYTSMVHCMVGCYTTMSLVKQLHRRLENEFSVCERLIALSGIDYDESEWEKAEKALMFSEFHDVIAGTIIKRVEDDTLRLLGYGREILSKYTIKAFLRLCLGEKKAEEGTVPIFVFNPHPDTVCREIEAEFQLANQNWNDNEVTIAHVYDEEGKELLAQNIKEESCLRLDWRKKIVFRAELKPMSMNRFTCRLEVKRLAQRPIEECAEENGCFIFKNKDMEVRINKATGLLDRYRVDGIDRLKPGSAEIAVYEDNADPWKMTTDGFYGDTESFTLLTDSEANAFNGYPGESKENVRVIENGSVILRLQAIFRHAASYAVVTYTIPKLGRHIDIHVKMLSNDADKMYKLTLHTPQTSGRLFGQTAFGREELLAGGKEVVYQKWCGIIGGDCDLAVLNTGSYGGSFRDDRLELSLLRTPIYTAHPINERPLSDSDRNHDRIDMGEREFDFRLTADTDELDFSADIFNQPPYALSFFPSGSGEKLCPEVRLSSRRIIMSCFRRLSEDKYLVRLFNSSEKAETAELCLFGTNSEIKLNAFEVKSFTSDKCGRLTAQASLLV